MERPTESTSAQPPPPSGWTLKRILVAGFLVVHWSVVTVMALPAPAWKAALVSWQLPVPMVNTHKGEELLSVRRDSPVLAYLALTYQYQSWSMYTLTRWRVVTLELELHYRDGSSRILREGEGTSWWPLRRERWRMMEIHLLTGRNRSPHLARACVAIARHFEPGPIVT